MFKSFTFSLLLLFITVAAHSQERSISGTIKNFQTSASIQGATIFLQSKTDTSLTRSSISDTAGRFQLSGLAADSFKLVISSIGFGTIVRNVAIDTADVALGLITLRTTSDVLGGVTVTATVPMATQKGDTTQYNASQFKVNPDATAEDLVKKMPGITSSNGTVTAHGETVQRVTIDGRELFGDDATAALRNLPAEIVDKIQVFDKLSDQAQFTGFDDGSSQKGINIITKASMRNGQFGRIFAGYGTDGRYSAGGNTTLLHENRKVSIVGNFNNINQQNFASQDLLGVTSSGGGGGPRGGGGGGGPRGGGGGAPRGGGGFQGGGNAGNFLVGQQSGINKTNAAGINYSDIWSPKLTVTGSYFFNNTNNNTSEILSRKYSTTGIPDYNQSTGANSKNTNHRISGRIEYKIDSANQIIITPSVSIQNNNSLRSVTSDFFDRKISLNRTRSTNNTSSSTRSGNNLNNSILYRHSFPKRGRTFSINLNTSSNNNSGDVYTDLYDTTFLGAVYRDSLSRRFTDQVTKGYQLSANAIYTEPLGKNSQLQLSYNPSYSKSTSDQQVYQYEQTSNKYSIFQPELSSKFDNTFQAQNAGLGYRYGTRDNQLSLGVNYQKSDLHSDQDFPRSLKVDKTFNNVLPNLMARLKLSTRSNIRLMYRANTNQPSVTQLQDVANITNRPFVSIGNPQLNQQYSHIVSTNYTYTNTGKGILFVGNVFVQKADNYITNGTFSPLRDSAIENNVVLKTGEQLSKPINMDGYISLRSFLNFAFPIKLIKSNVNLNGGLSYSRLPGINNNISSLTNNTTYTAGVVIASNVSQFVDFTVSYSGNINNVKNKTTPGQNGNFFSQNAGVQFNLLTKKGWFLQNDLNNVLTSGYGEGFNRNFYLWNVGVGKKFLKDQKGELKLSVFDLLKQNQSITRNVGPGYIEDASTRVLQQYFMLTFSYNLRTFGVAARNNNNNFNRNRNWGGGRPTF
jgi:hypothetical protein